VLRADASYLPSSLNTGSLIGNSGLARSFAIAFHLGQIVRVVTHCSPDRASTGYGEAQIEGKPGFNHRVNATLSDAFGVTEAMIGVGSASSRFRRRPREAATRRSL
jgi:hypothetical protein